ncbi:hypothetical protein ACQEUR_09990 [Plantactinospora sp. CA-290183]
MAETYGDGAVRAFSQQQRLRRAPQQSGQDEMSTTNPDPADDRAVRARAHTIMTQVYYELRNVITRYYDEDGLYIEPTGVSDGGDNTGMIRAANNEVLSRLDAEVQRARDSLTEILIEIDNHKRQQFGPGYNPALPKL